MRVFKQKSAIIIVALFFGFNNSVLAEYFTNLVDESKILFQHNNGQSGNFNYPEIVGSGVALLDVDNDGDLDIYFVQSGAFDKNKLTDELYINEISLTNKLAFKKSKSKLQKKTTGYGIGIATADINNDGWMDFYLTNYKNNQLFVNQSGKGFAEKNIKENNHLWSSSASFCDINNDGFKDLYVSNYVEWSPENNPKCYNASSKQDFCGPNTFQGLKDSFYLNESGKSMLEKTDQFFPEMPQMPGLNVICQDLNNDGFNDFIVANDGKPNLVWLNQKGVSFKEHGLFSGLAVNAQGVAEASMGMATADYDADGDLDIFFTHLMNESNTLYQNNGKGFFRDVSNRTKLSAQSMAFTGWAAGFLMVNDDVYPDLVIFNGAVADASDKKSDKASLDQFNQLFLNSSNGQFIHVNNEQWLRKKANTRGASFGDLDNDGDIDIVVSNNNAEPDILINNLNPEQWMGLRIYDSLHRNFTVLLYNDTNTMQINTQTDGAYASAHDDRLVFNQAQLSMFDGVKIIHQNKVVFDLALSNTKKYQTIKLK
ncbi:MAG: FG-GAP repeat domain-containing protein [Marinicellaceae bacterium]